MIKIGKKNEKIIAPPHEIEHKPWAFAPFSLPQAYAIQAMQRGEATPEQQIMALDWILNPLCRTYDMSYRPDSARDTDFAEGRRSVGLQIIKVIKTNLAIYKGPKDE